MRTNGNSTPGSLPSARRKYVAPFWVALAASGLSSSAAAAISSISTTMARTSSAVKAPVLSNCRASATAIAVPASGAGFGLERLGRLATCFSSGCLS